MRWLCAKQGFPVGPAVTRRGQVGCIGSPARSQLTFAGNNAEQKRTMSYKYFRVRILIISQTNLLVLCTYSVLPCSLSARGPRRRSPPDFLLLLLLVSQPNGDGAHTKMAREQRPRTAVGCWAITDAHSLVSFDCEPMRTTGCQSDRHSSSM